MARTRLVIAALLTIAFASNAPAIAAGEKGDLPPPIGPVSPAVVPTKSGDGIYHQDWFLNSFLDLKEDLAAANANGKRLAVIFEQRGCLYCTKMHTEVLSQRYINDYVRSNFDIIQLDLWGAREVTDFDGTVLTEKKLAERWRIQFTPSIVFFKDDLTGLEGKWGRDVEVLRMMLGIGPGTFYDVFTWIAHRVYEKDPNFQRFHLMRFDEREALKTAKSETVN